jgi:ATP-dependent exoDNAse (exonuclease V) beta subunit
MIRAREAISTGDCRRETPVTVNLADGTLVEGVLDLAFLEKDGWTVVDFKTDRELEKELERYKRQVALYALAISRATGQTCAGILMKI